MSVEVINLTKSYGEQKAVDQISFSAKKGEITGFLGPNGAGKSTTMKIATGYVPPSEGTIHVAGEDVVINSIKIKRLIGYLPEHNPLYLDMYVHEYLSFIGNANQLKGGELRKRKSEIIELCGLGLEQNKLIGALSKGYRQRVGLAQALLHDPEVLILDEPTTGLDPNQILEIRKVIKQISENKTVIFSTHIMQEVQALCDHVIIINRGKIVKNDSLKSLQDSMSENSKLNVEFSEKIDAALFNNLDEVLSIVPAGEFNYLLEVEKGKDIRNDILSIASKENLPLVGLKQESASLEDLFHQLTQNEA